MCGIVGQVSHSHPIDAALLRRMCGRIQHRGPDDEGFYLAPTVGLGMRRLSVIDVAGGHQPQCNEDGTIWIIFNGEIYNFRELYTELQAKGHRFKTRSDTEAIVHLYEEMGEQCVTRLNGMFAFALWDAPRQRLLLARDRLGKKPIHYVQTPQGLFFASEIAALLENPAIERRLNPLALAQYLRLWYAPAPLTMFEGIFKLPPAHILINERGQTRLERYWDVSFAHKQAYSEAEWEERLLELLQDSVQRRLISDVPLGAFLSGGIDSSLVVALMAQGMDQPVKTFSIGFTDEAYNELAYARQVADYLGTDHHEEIVKPDAVTLLPELVRHYGEPFGDESCIPTYYVSRLARRQVTVALSGDGGDENFGGYPRLARHLAFDPVDSLRGLLAGEVKAILASHNPLTAAVSPARWREFWHELTFRVDEIRDPVKRYTHAWTVWKNGYRSPFVANQTVVTDEQVLAPLRRVWQQTQGWDPLDQWLYVDLKTYLPDDLQVKMDIASMAASLEVRSPLLDYRLVEMAAQMPAHLKITQGQTKVLLRRLAGRLTPPTIAQRSKMGFSMPIADWLRHDLRPMVYDLLLGRQATQRGLFEPRVVERLIQRHMAGEADYGRHLWLLLVFELWATAFLTVDRVANSATGV